MLFSLGGSYFCRHDVYTVCNAVGLGTELNGGNNQHENLMPLQAMGMGFSDMYNIVGYILYMEKTFLMISK